MLSAPLEAAWSSLLDHFVVLKMEVWSKDKEYSQVRRLLRQAVTDGDLDQYIWDKYGYHMKRFNALRAALKKYHLTPDGILERLPEDEWGSRESILHNDFIEESFNNQYNKAMDRMYKKTDMDLVFHHKGVESTVDALKYGLACPHCDGFGELENPARFKADGSQIPDTGTPLECESCDGVGHYLQGNMAYSKEKAADMRRKLRDAQGLGWQGEPNEVEIERELTYLLEASEKGDDGRDTLPSGAGYLRRFNFNVPSGKIAFEEHARKRAERARLLGDPHQLESTYREMDLLKFRNMLAHMLAWERVEAYLDGDEQPDEVHAVATEAMKRTKDDPDSDTFHPFLKAEYDRHLKYLERENNAEVEQNRRTDKALQSEAWADTQEKHKEQSLFNHFIPAARREAASAEEYDEQLKYLKVKSLDKSHAGKEAEIRMHQVTSQAVDFLKNVWFMCTNTTAHNQDSYEVQLAEDPLTGETTAEGRSQAERNMDRLKAYWNQLGQEMGGRDSQKMALSLFLDDEPFLALAIEEAMNQATPLLPEDAPTILANTIYGSGFGPFGKEVGSDDLSVFLRVHAIARPEHEHEYAGGVDERPSEHEVATEEGGFIDMVPGAGDRPVHSLEDTYDRDEELGSEYEEATAGEGGALGDIPIVDDERELPGKDEPLHRWHRGEKSLPGIEKINFTHRLDFQNHNKQQLRQQWDDEKGYSDSEGMLYGLPMRDGLLIDMVHDVLNTPGEENLAQRTRLFTTGSKSLLEYLSGTPEPGPARRHWLDDLIYQGQFKSGTGTPRFGKVQSNYQDWLRMENLRKLLLHDNGAEKTMAEVVETKQFIDLFNRDILKMEMRGMSREDREKMERAVRSGERLSGTLRSCDNCDEQGYILGTVGKDGIGDPCRYTEGSGDDLRECSGLEQIGSPPKAGRIKPKEKLPPGSDQSINYFQGLMTELLGGTTYGDGTKEYGSPDPAHPSYGAFEHKYEKGLLQRAEEYDKHAAHALGLRVLCPECKGTQEVGGQSCGRCTQGVPRSLRHIDKDGRSYVPDTRAVRDLHGGLRAEGLGSYQSIQDLLGRIRALRTHAERQKIANRVGGPLVNKGRKQIQDSLLNHFIPSDGPHAYLQRFGYQEPKPPPQVAGRPLSFYVGQDKRLAPPTRASTPYEIHPILGWPELHYPGAPLSPEGVSAAREEIRAAVKEGQMSGQERRDVRAGKAHARDFRPVDPDDPQEGYAAFARLFSRKYRNILRNIPSNLEGFEKEVIEHSRPSNAVKCEWFKKLIEILNFPFETSGEIKEHLKHASFSDIDGRNVRQDEGLMTTEPCVDCKGSGYMGGADGENNLWRPCRSCKGTKSDSVRAQLLRNPERYEDLTDEQIQTLFARGEMDREYGRENSYMDNPHISPSHCPCEVCHAGLAPEIYEGEDVGQAMKRGGRDATSPLAPTYTYVGQGCKKCGQTRKDCKCSGGYLQKDPVLEYKPQKRARTRKPSVAPLFTRPASIMPVLSRTSESADRRQALYRQLLDSMQELRHIGSEYSGKPFGSRKDQNTGKSIALSTQEIEEKIEGLVALIRQDDTRDAWSERVGQFPLPELSEDWKSDSPYLWTQSTARRIAGLVGPCSTCNATGYLDPEHPEKGPCKACGGSTSRDFHDVAWEYPCPFCVNEFKHDTTIPVHTLREHRVAEEDRLSARVHPVTGDPMTWSEESMFCPVAQKKWDKHVEKHGAAPTTGTPPSLLDMHNDVFERSMRSEEENDYHALMEKLEPGLDEALHIQREGLPHKEIMKQLKPGQLLSIPVISPVPAAVIVNARLASLGGRNLFGRTRPMSPSDRLDNVLPESLDNLSAFLKAVQSDFPVTVDEHQGIQTLLAMHILEKDLLIHMHGNPLKYPNVTGSTKNLLQHWLDRISGRDYSGHAGKVEWARRILGKARNDYSLTTAERTEFKEKFHELHPYLGLEYEWQKYLKNADRRGDLQEVFGEHEVLGSLFNTTVNKRGSPLAGGLFASLIHPSNPSGKGIELVMDMLTRHAEYKATLKSSAHFDSDKHGYMQPYENFPSTYWWWYNQDSTPNPALIGAWLKHDDTALRAAGGPKWVVTGKSWAQIKESGLLDTLWEGITGGRDIRRTMRLQRKDKPQLREKNPTVVKIIDGKKFPSLDEMLQLRDNEHSAIKGAWYHLKKEILLRSSRPEISKKRMMRAGQFFAPVGLNMLGTGARCLACQGHGIHHTIDEAGVWHGVQEPYYDEHGNRDQSPNIVVRDEAGKPVMVESSDRYGKGHPKEGQRKMRWERRPLQKRPGSERIDWGHRDSIKFIHENLRTPYEERGEKGWENYFKLMKGHTQIPSEWEIKDEEGGFTPEYINWLSTQEFGCSACKSTGHCGGCGGSGESGRTDAEHSAIQGIQLVNLIIQNRGLGIEQPDDGRGISRYFPENAAWLKPDLGLFTNQVVGNAPMGQHRRYFEDVPSEYEPMDLIAPDGREFTIPGMSEYEEAFDKEILERQRALCASLIRNMSDEDKKFYEYMGEAIPTVDEIPDNEDDINDFVDSNVLDDTEYYNKLYDIPAEVQDPKTGIGKYNDWRLDHWVDQDPLGYHTLAQNATARFGNWPEGSFANYLAKETGTKAHPYLTNTLLQLEPRGIAGLLYAFHHRKIMPSLDLMPEWWTKNHEMGLNHTGYIFPEKHFPSKIETDLRCEHPECDPTIDPTGEHTDDECVYCQGTGDLAFNEHPEPKVAEEHDEDEPDLWDGKKHVCPVCDGLGEYSQRLRATHGPEMPGELNNPHGNYCSHHHPIIMQKMDTPHEYLDPRMRNIAGGDFARNLLRLTALSKAKVASALKPGGSLDPQDIDVGLVASGMAHLLPGLQFLGFHLMKGSEGQEDYHIPMFERGGHKFSIFDLGEGHTSDSYGLGNQHLFQKRDYEFGSGRDVDEFDRPGWGFGRLGNSLPRIRVQGNGTPAGNEIASIQPTDISPNIAVNKSQYKVPKSHAICPKCMHVVGRKNKETGEYFPCEGCGYGFSKDELKEFSRDLHVRDFLFGKEGPGSPPDHVIEREHRERLRHRLTSIVGEKGDPAIKKDEEGKPMIDPHPRNYYYLMTDHYGKALRYPQWETHPTPEYSVTCSACGGSGEEIGRKGKEKDGSAIWGPTGPCLRCRGRGEEEFPAMAGVPHSRAGQRVFAKQEVPADEPLCSWYSYSGVPVEHNALDSRLSKAIPVRDYLSKLKSILIEHDEDGNPIPKTNKAGEVVEDSAGFTVYEMAKEDKALLAKMAHILKQDSKGNYMFRVPVLHPGFGADLGQGGGIEKDGFHGLTSPKHVETVVKKANEHMRDRQHSSVKIAKNFLVDLARVDPTGRFDTPEKLGKLHDQGWAPNEQFLNWLTGIPNRLRLPKTAEPETLKRIYEQWTAPGAGNLRSVMTEHAEHVHNHLWQIVVPKKREKHSLDENLTVNTIEDPKSKEGKKILATILSGFQTGNDRVPMLVNGDENARAMATSIAHPVDGTPLRNQDLSFGIRPDRYHTLMNTYAAQAHNHATDFQVNHFPYQAAVDSMNRGPTTQEAVDKGISKVEVLGADGRLDVISDTSPRPQIKPEDSDQWWYYSTPNSFQAPPAPSDGEEDYQE